MEWEELRNKLWSKEENARTDVLLKLENEGLITIEQTHRLCDLSIDYPEVDVLLGELAKKYGLI